MTTADLARIYTTVTIHKLLFVKIVNPNQGNQMKNLCKALSAFQKNELKAKKNMKSHYGDYSDLESVWDTIRDPLVDNGFSICQTIRNDDNIQYLDTTLYHESGESITSSMKLDFQTKNVQGFGAMITYCRRYSICALLGIVSDPDVDQTQKIESCEFTKKEPTLTKQQVETLKSLCIEPGWEQGLLGHLGLKKMEDIKQNRFESCKKMLETKAKQLEKQHG